MCDGLKWKKPTIKWLNPFCKRETRSKTLFGNPQISGENPGLSSRYSVWKCPIFGRKLGHTPNKKSAAYLGYIPPQEFAAFLPCRGV